MNSTGRIKASLGLLILLFLLCTLSVSAFADASDGSFLFGFSNDPTANTLVLKMSDGSVVVVDNLRGAFNTCNGPQCIPSNLSQLGQPIPNQGWWSVNTASPNSNENPNYVAGTGGGETFRDFFSFDLSGVTGTVVGAALELQRFVDASSTGPYVGYNIGSVSIGNEDSYMIAAQLNDKSDHTNDAVNFNALSNNDFGMFAVPVGGAMTDIFHFDLSGTAVGDINAEIGSTPINRRQYFNIGGSTYDVVAGDGSQSVTVQSSRTQPSGTVPEPASMLIFGVGLGYLGLKRRK